MTTLSMGRICHIGIISLKHSSSFIVLDLGGLLGRFIENLTQRESKGIMNSLGDTRSLTSPFSREDNKIAMKHISRFTTQCGELSNHNFYKLRVFLNSLIGHAFIWYTNLLPNSIFTWAKIEDKFQTHFVQADLSIFMVDLARLRQQPSEMVEQFIMRFKNAKS